MKSAVGLSACLALGVALAPGAAHAGGPFGFHAHRGFLAHGHVGRHAGGSHRFHGFHRFRGGFGFGFPSTVLLYGAPVVEPLPGPVALPAPADPAPVVYAPQTVVYAPPASPPPASVPPAPVAPPAPTVAEFPTGRYELRGDGVAAPYVWVWIPNPPTAPPPTASGPAAPVASPGKIYRWTDEQGTVYWTNRPDRIPEPYRSRAQPPTSSGAPPS